MQREIFKHLGRVLYSTRIAQLAVDDMVVEFMQVFVDQSAFMQVSRTIVSKISEIDRCRPMLGTRLLASWTLTWFMMRTISGS